MDDSQSNSDENYSQYNTSHFDYLNAINLKGGIA